MTFYTVKQASLILGFSTNSVYKFVNEGRLQSTRGSKKSGRFRISHTAIEKFLKVKLPENALAKALETAKPSNRPTINVTSDELIKDSPPFNQLNDHTLIRSNDALHPSRLTPVLIILSLLGLLADLIINPNYSLFQNGLRLLLLIALLVLSFQKNQQVYV